MSSGENSLAAILYLSLDVVKLMDYLVPIITSAFIKLVL